VIVRQTIGNFIGTYCIPEKLLLLLDDHDFDPTVSYL